MTIVECFILAKKNRNEIETLINKKSPKNMNQTLKDELCLYLGELIYEYENEFDWIKKNKVTKKINAVHILLGINEKKETWSEKVIKELKKINKKSPC